MAVSAIDRSASVVKKAWCPVISTLGALAATIFFFLCWVGAFLPFGPVTHMYLQLFTSADVNSGLALWQGLCWSLAFGLIAGAVIALSYKLVAAVDGR